MTGKWGNTVCDVVFYKDQFSWTRSKRKNKPSGKSWKDSKKAVDMLLKGVYIKQLSKSMHYHTISINPEWSDKNKVVKVIGNHIFYKDIN